MEQAENNNGRRLFKEAGAKLPPITVTWDEAQQPWKDFKAGHPGPGGFGTSCSAGELCAVDTSLEERFFEERLVVAGGILHVRFAYDYEIELSRIKTPLHLIRWTLHLAEKTWMKKRFLEAFIKEICKAKGWNPYGGQSTASFT